MRLRATPSAVASRFHIEATACVCSSIEVQCGMRRYHSEDQGNENEGEFRHEISPYRLARSPQAQLRYSR
jgi:hypothetical protein